jgi:hypothetical protein
MEIIWSKEKRDEFIKLCVESINKNKKTQIQIK